jgi:hypothetical protein
VPKQNDSLPKKTANTAINKRNIYSKLDETRRALMESHKANALFKKNPKSMNLN